MYQFNLRNLKVVQDYNWVRKVEAEQAKLRDLNSNRVGGFAIENNLIPNNGDHIRLVEPNKIWVFKLWRVSVTEVKSMIFKGLNIKLFSKTDLDASKEYLLLKPEYSGREGQYLNHNCAIEYANCVEYKQPMYIIDITNFEYTVFFSNLDTIVTTDKEYIDLYNEGKETHQGGIMLRKIKTSDNAFLVIHMQKKMNISKTTRHLSLGLIVSLIYLILLSSQHCFLIKQKLKSRKKTMRHTLTLTT